MPSSRYFAVAGPNDRSRRSRAACEDRGRVGCRDLRRRADRDRLQVLRAHDRAEAAAAGVPAVVRDRRVPDAALAGRADRGHPPAPAEFAAQLRVGVGGGHAAEVGRVDEPGAVAVDEQCRGLACAAADHDRVVAGELPGDRELAGGQRVGQHPGQRRLRHHGELRAGGQRRAHQRREHERQRRRGVQGAGPRRPQPVQQPGAEAGAADVRAQDLIRQRQDLTRPRRWRPRQAPVRSNRRRPCQPPASADRKKTVSPATSGVSPSLVI